MNQLTIQMLNDDCLRYISRFISFYDRVILATTCYRFYDLFRYDIAQREITSIDIDLITKRLSLRSLLTIFGADIRRITLKSPRVNRLIFLPDYCYNLENLQFDCLTPDTCEGVDFEKLHNLRSLKIIRGFQLNHEALQKISQLRRLEVLHMSDVRIDVECLTNLTALTELLLSGCSQIKIDSFTKLIQANRNIKRLTILECKTLGVDAFRCVAETLKNLEYLAFDDSALSNCRFLADMQPLKCVDVTENCTSTRLCEQTVRQLALYHSETLEELCCRSDNEDGLMLPINVSFPRLTTILVETLKCSDNILYWLSHSCTQLQSFRLEPKSPAIWRRRIEISGKISIARQQLVNFVINTRSLRYIAVPLELLTISLYRELVNIRRTMHATERLILVLKHSPIPYFMKQQISLRKEYSEQAKFVDIKLER